MQQRFAAQSQTAIDIAPLAPVPDHGGHLFATVIKRNRKTVGVVTDDGRRWKIAPVC